MVKKTKPPQVESSDQVPDLAKAVHDSAQQIWLAGLGAFRKAQQEGSKAFDKLVKEGAPLHQFTESPGDKRLPDIARQMAKAQDTFSRQANNTWDKLEGVFESRVARSLTALGVPTRDQVESLTRRIAALETTLATAKRVTGTAARKSSKPVSRKAAD